MGCILKLYCSKVSGYCGYAKISEQYLCLAGRFTNSWDIMLSSLALGDQATRDALWQVKNRRRGSSKPFIDYGANGAAYFQFML
jgi:hypothetical protein